MIAFEIAALRQVERDEIGLEVVDGPAVVDGPGATVVVESPLATCTFV